VEEELWDILTKIERLTNSVTTCEPAEGLKVEVERKFQRLHQLKVQEWERQFLEAQTQKNSVYSGISLSYYNEFNADVLRMQPITFPDLGLKLIQS
jgi:hypothetical protein